ncbi:MAG: apolipoprotein N-acyltransferase [Campylobacterota bacterium]|nr:apolipoprotein N-acyltransferase [Campylobacterota bacterium]
MFSIKSIILSVSMSLFIYFEYFNLTNSLVNTIVGLFSFYILFTLNKKELFFAGFLIGIFWFWWIGYSFIYYNLLYLIPFVLIGIGTVYGVLFYIGGLVNNLLYKIVYFFALSFINPFGFNWFVLELPFINSYLGTSKIDLFIILLATSALIYSQIKNRFKLGILFYSVCLVSLSIFNKPILNTTPSNLKVKMQNTTIPQVKKWDKKYRETILNENFNNIKIAIEKNNDLIIFPETSFPIVLNHQKYIQKELLKYSKDISILLGALYEKDGLLYNSSYLFQDGVIKIANKVVLVPFGEAVPLPQKLRDIINNTFYNGAKDYETAKKATTFNIKGTKFRNAICYEATTNEIYKNLDTSYVIAISNNAWFTPSHQPVLQKLLMKYYAYKYNLYIYNVTNEG